MADLSSVSTNFFATASETFSNNLASSISAGATTVPVNNASAYTTGDIVVLTVEPGTANEATFIGQKDTGNQFINCVWTEGNTGVGHSAGASVIDYTAATHQAALVKGIKKFANQDGTLITQAVRDALGLGTTAPQGWEPLGYTPATITHNGNRSYTLTFTGVNLTTAVSSGMRMLFNKTEAGNGYMGGLFNGSSHYFTKTSPTGTLGTVTNNFTIEANVMPTSYAQGFACGRGEATANNGLGMRMEATGQITIVAYSGGSGNYRTVATYQSLPLNKKTHVAASWASGTVVIYFDGVSVPVQAATTSGSAPTTAGTGGDWSIGAWGAFATQRFPGYISNVAVFDAVLSAATIRDHATRKLTGSETNCIGAWSLDNTVVNQKSPGTNDLTAMGGVGFTAMTPHGQLENGIEVNKAVGLIMSTSYSTDTTINVQLPEGCTLPTTGGVSAVYYSYYASPFGFVSDKGRWEVLTHYLTYTNFTPTVGTVYNPNNMQILKPYGNWLASYRITARAGYSNVVGSYTVVQTFLGTTQASTTGRLYPSTIDTGTDAGTGPVVWNSSHTLLPVQMQNTAQATYYLNWTMNTGATPYANQCGFYGTTQTLTLTPSGL